ncbi:MAG TPA: amino acid adenylation domain-containing protein [Haliangium sp.]|nr:amino acid adenylation domain-containing protein [Haliangium sp.]
MTAGYLIHQLLAAQAARHSEWLAVIDRDQSLTYAELAAQSEVVARALRERGAGPGTPVGLWMEKTATAVAALYGILASGAAYVPIDPQSPPGRAARIAENCGMRHLVTSARMADKRLDALLADVPGGIAHVLVAEPPGPGQAAGDLDLAVRDHAPLPAPGRALTAGPSARAEAIDEDLAYILHTSGSTGRPKGVAITHRNALCFVDMCVDFFGVTASDRLVSHAPLHFDLSVFDLFVAVAAGAACVLMPSFFSGFPHKMAEHVQTHGITVWSSVASALTLMHDRGRLDRCRLDSLRAVIFSGEVMPVRVLRALRAHMPAAVFYNVYGQTEANSSMCHRVDRIPDDDAARLPIGRAFPNFDVFALDDGGRVIDQPGVEGELYVRAGTVAAGYYGDAERTARAFVPDPRAPITGGRVYRTGDRVILDEQGAYHFRGRTDNLIKSRGYRIELGEVELALSACDGVGRAAVVAVPDDSVGHRLHAFVSPRDGATLSAETLRAQLGRHLPDYMVPEHVTVRDDLPQTSTGKVDRNALRADIAGAGDT